MIIVLPFSRTLKMTLLSLGPIHNLIPTILSSMMNGLPDKANRRMVEVVNFRKKYFTLGMPVCRDHIMILDRQPRLQTRSFNQ
jgi:hypothetical protein